MQAAVTGPVGPVAFGNANPRGVARFRQPVAKTWHGRALAVLRPTGGSGVAAIRIEAEGLSPAGAALMVGATTQRPGRK